VGFYQNLVQGSSLCTVCSTRFDRVSQTVYNGSGETLLIMFIIHLFILSSCGSSSTIVQIQRTAFNKHSSEGFFEEAS